MWKRPVLTTTIFIAIAALISIALDRNIPPQHLPWRKLNPEAPLGFATKSQMLRMSLMPSEICMDMARDSKGLNSIPADPKESNSVCGWQVARVVYGSEAGKLSPGEANMQCPLAIGTYMWLREINASAREHLGVELKQVYHVGTYSCRRQNGNASGRWSEHAFANAWDITGFQLSDNRVISVLNDWNGEDKARRKFLREVRDKACKIFRVTLSPDYNRAHRDHFHVDMGPSNACR
jgi:hypothetical protein